MEKEKLGTLKRVELKRIWQLEASDFSKWLSKEKNIALLSDTIGIIIDPDSLVMEDKVGDFRVDISGQEEGTDRKIIIENQLEDTNHDHLGKLITYASGKQASILIWIVKHAREEHKQAIEWLNQHTDNTVGFFLIEIELWQIGDSPVAPKFNIVEKPNTWAKTINDKTLSKNEQLLFDFWSQFNDDFNTNVEFARSFRPRTPQAANWYDLAIGNSHYYISLTLSPSKHEVRCSIYFSNSKDIYNQFYNHRNELEATLGDLKWNEANKDCRIYLVHPNVDLEDRSQWKEVSQWLYKESVLFKKAIREVEKVND